MSISSASAVRDLKRKLDEAQRQVGKLEKERDTAQKGKKLADDVLDAVLALQSEKHYNKKHTKIEGDNPLRSAGRKDGPSLSLLTHSFAPPTCRFRQFCRRR